MQLRYQYPVDAVGGSCVVLKEYDPKDGVIDLDVNLDALPAWGRLCISARAVRAMADLLGYDLTPKAEVRALRTAIADRDAKLERLRAAAQGVADATIEALAAAVEPETKTEAGVDDPPAEEGDASVLGGAGALPAEGDTASDQDADAVSPDAGEVTAPAPEPPAEVKPRSRRK